MNERLRFASLLLFCGLSLALGWWRGGVAAWFLFYGACALLLHCVFVYMFSLRHIDIQRELSPVKVIAGEPVTVTLTVRLRTWLPLIWLVVSDCCVTEHGDKDGLIDSGGGKGIQRWVHRKLLFPWFRKHIVYQYRLTQLQRGSYRFISTHCMTGDCFGFVTKKKSSLAEAAFLVFPRPLEVRLAHWSGGEQLALGSVQARLSRNGDTPAGFVRDYASGDPIRRIHWKSTAKSGELKTAMTEIESSRPLLILLDASAASYGSLPRGEAVFETCLTAAAGLLRHAAGQKRRAAFVCRGAVPYSVPFGHTLDMPREFSFLATAASNGQTVYRDVVRAESEQLSSDVLLVCVTGLLDESLMEELLRQLACGRKVEFIYVYGTTALSAKDRQWKQQLEQSGCRFTALSCPAAEPQPKGGVEDVGSVGA